MIIREETEADIGPITTITEAAFAGHPHSHNTEARIIAALRQAGALSMSLVAEEADAVVGHIAFSPVTIESVTDGWFALGPVSVAPALQRMGIGGALIRKGLSLIEKQGAFGCVLIGDPAYYRRLGFKTNSALTYRDLPEGYLQYITFSGAQPHGEVQFHPAFGVT